MPAPNKPAPVSGPGRLARRTDGPAQPVRDLPNAQYGEAAEYRTLQQGAPLAKAPAPSAAPQAASGGGAGPSLPTGFGEPTQRPGEPITAGADTGPGPGMAALGLPDPNEDLRARLWAAYQAYPNEDLREILEAMD